MLLSQTISLVATAVSLYVALLSRRFSKAPGWQDQRFFALIALSGALYTFIGAAPDSLVVAATEAQIAAAGLHIAAWIRFSAAFLGHEPTRAERTVMGAVVVTGFSALVPGAYFSGAVTSHLVMHTGVGYADAVPTLFGGVALAVLCGAMVWLVLRFAAAWRRGVPHAPIHTLGLCVLALAAMNDSIVASTTIGMPYLLDIGFMVPVAAVGYALTARFVEGARALETLSAQLETAVADRTKELARTQEALHRAEKLGALGQLAAGVAHEINNPAAAIAANVRYLQESLETSGTLPSDGLACLEEAHSSIDRITGVVRQLLDAGRLAGSSSTQTEGVSLAAVVAEAARIARPHYGERVKLVRHVPVELHGLGREPALVQVLANLLVNAAQAIPPERSDGRVEVSAARVGDRVELVVADDGTGMSEETLRRLFEPFFTTKAFGEGTGLGLAVSRGLIVALGGQLHFSSVLGRGSRATLELPAADAPPPRAEVRDDASVPAGPPRRVLIIDDDPELRSALRRCLKSRYEVALTDGTESALAMLRDDDAWDLIVCDLMMADGGGARVYDTLRAERPGLAARMIFLTGGAVTSEARSFLDAQPQPVLYKPLDLIAFARLAEQLSARRTTTQPASDP
jgi:signal transduction histidine kinase/ActR/RegA family two-component response regulator